MAGIDRCLLSVFVVDGNLRPKFYVLVHTLMDSRIGTLVEYQSSEFVFESSKCQIFIKSGSFTYTLNFAFIPTVSRCSPNLDFVKLTPLEKQETCNSSFWEHTKLRPDKVISVLYSFISPGLSQIPISNLYN